MCRSQTTRVGLQRAASPGWAVPYTLQPLGDEVVERLAARVHESQLARPLAAADLGVERDCVRLAPERPRHPVPTRHRASGHASTDLAARVREPLDAHARAHAVPEQRAQWTARAATAGRGGTGIDGRSAPAEPCARRRLARLHIRLERSGSAGTAFAAPEAPRARSPPARRSPTTANRSATSARR